MFFCISLLRIQVSPYLLRDSLAYIFSLLLVNKIYVTRVLWKNCVFVLKSLVYRGEIKGSGTFLM